jgi:hypothetical protein
VIRAPHAPNIEWQVEAVNHVDRLLKTVTAALDAAGIPYAVVGGNAIATWVATRDVGAVRATKDVDILLRRTDLDRAEQALRAVGLIREEVLGIPVFVDAKNPLPSQGVHVVVANEKVRGSALYPAPDVTGAFRSESGFLVLDLALLVAMKLEANRRIDQVHMEDLLRMGLIDAKLASKLPPELLERLRYVRDTMEWLKEPPEF